MLLFNRFIKKSKPKSYAVIPDRIPTEFTDKLILCGRKPNVTKFEIYTEDYHKLLEVEKKWAADGWRTSIWKIDYPIEEYQIMKSFEKEDKYSDMSDEEYRKNYKEDEFLHKWTNRMFNALNKHKKDSRNWKYHIFKVLKNMLNDF